MEDLQEKPKLQKYDSYKASDVEWLGEIPEHWESIRMKFLYKDYSEKNRPNEELLSVTQNSGVIPRSWVENRMVMPSGNLTSFKFIKEGDFAISLRSFEGGLEYCYHDGIISPAYTVLKNRKSNLEAEYYKYLFKSHSFISELQTSVVGIRQGKNISFEELSYSIMPIPPLQEQKAIANFLDQKTSQLDTAVAQKEALIQLLKERKQILIQNAVTGKVVWNDKEQKMVPLALSGVVGKDSGVEWIGEIPEHWEVKKFRYIFSLGKGLTITKENLKEDGVFCVNYGEIHSKYGFEVDTNIHSLKCVDKEYVDTNPSSMIENGDFIFADTSEDIEGSGNFTYLKSNDKIFAGYHTVIAKPKTKMNSRFFAYQFDSESFRNQIRTGVKGVKVYSITQSILKRPFVWIPPIIEQNKIVEYLDIESQKIDQAIALQQAQIEKLKEYKHSLIDAAVTGKVKVF